MGYTNLKVLNYIDIPLLTAEEEREIKIEKSIELSCIHKGTDTIANVLARVPSSIIDDCHPAIIASVMDTISKAYHDGRASTGAEMFDTNVVWINRLGKAIEWVETGAEYKEITEIIDGRDGPSYKSTRQEKIKDGVLTPRFCEV